MSENVKGRPSPEGLAALKRLMEHLSQNGVSQWALARKIGVNQSTVSRWLSGEAMPSSESLGRIASVYQTTEVRDMVLDIIVKGGAAPETIEGEPYDPADYPLRRTENDDEEGEADRAEPFLAQTSAA